MLTINNRSATLYQLPKAHPRVSSSPPSVVFERWQHKPEGTKSFNNWQRNECKEHEMILWCLGVNSADWLLLLGQVGFHDREESLDPDAHLCGVPLFILHTSLWLTPTQGTLLPLGSNIPTRPSYLGSGQEVSNAEQVELQPPTGHHRPRCQQAPPRRHQAQPHRSPAEDQNARPAFLTILKIWIYPSVVVKASRQTQIKTHTITAGKEIEDVEKSQLLRKDLQP